MAGIVMEDVSKVYADGTTAVSDLSLDVKDEEFIVLVGPSGCGKTTALRMVAGLESITHGTIAIGDRVVNTVPPKERDIAMVFQNYALYPHMTVYDNMAFGLKLRKLPKEEIERRVRRAAEILGLVEFLERKPKALSGGQRQRVAMGRAIVREPQAFLMDEPLSNLDAKLRLQMRNRSLTPAGRSRRHDDLCHARSGRGHDDGRSRRRPQEGRAATGRCSPDALRPSEEPVRGRLHRLARDEHGRGRSRSSGRWAVRHLRHDEPSRRRSGGGRAPGHRPTRANE
jgi:ABC-type nitrate/sulfonate/bicarbonate transport system ATPase subunit